MTTPSNMLNERDEEEPKPPKDRSALLRVEQEVVEIVVHAEQHEPRRKLIVMCQREVSVRSGWAATLMGSRPMRSYSAITWAPSSRTRVPNSTLNKTATAVVNEP